MLTGAWYVSILLSVGAAAAARAAGRSADHQRRLTALAIGCALAWTVTTLARLWFQTTDAFGSDQPIEWSQVEVILFETPWGRGWRWQAGAVFVALLTTVAWRREWRLWPAATLATTAAAFTTAFTGHAVGMDTGTTSTVVAHGTHVIAAGWWLGALTCLLIVTGSSAELGHAIRRFSPQAVAAVTLLVLAGLFATWRHVGSWAGLATPYGLALCTKIGAFLAAGACGLYNWRVLAPALERSEDARRQLRALAWLEVSLGLIAIVLTALVGTLSMPDEVLGGH